MEGSIRCSTNYVPLSPISFLVSIVYGDTKFTWAETCIRCLKLASALSQLGISHGDVVAALAPNTPAMYELHFGVPMAGAVLCTFNVRHDSAMVSVLLKHSEEKVIFVDYLSLNVAKGAFQILSNDKIKLPLLVLIPDSDKPLSNAHSRTTVPGDLEYETLLATGRTNFEIVCTTSSPKGVVYSHRGAYLNSLAAVFLNEMPLMPVYLWTVPMLHCNGWCLTWGVAAQGGTNICLRNHQVSHMGGAPTVLNMIINAPPSIRKPLPRKVAVMTGGAPPPPRVLFMMEELGFGVTHSYGLTETYGPGTACTWKPEWNSLSPDEQAKIKARQGLHHIGMEEVDVRDPVSMKRVSSDAKTMGEVMFRGNTVMNGYLKNLKATEDAFKGGWFRSGDLAVKHPDGCIELKDRAKDIIISGGENISTIEVESVIFSHPAILETAVVGRPDNYWGETPCAFVKLKDGNNATADEIIKYCRDRLPNYMAPKTLVFNDLPKTSTGKTPKFALRQRAKAMGSISKASKL
ncbi:unnamed protein product [Withania somnifera]